MVNPSQQNTPQSDISGSEPAPDFEGWASRNLRSTFPDGTASMSDDELRERIRSCAARCEHYGLESGEQILCFASVGFLIGQNFDSDPNHAWAAEVLADAEMSADGRAAMLVAICELMLEHAEVRDAESG